MNRSGSDYSEVDAPIFISNSCFPIPNINKNICLC